MASGIGQRSSEFITQCFNSSFFYQVPSTNEALECNYSSTNQQSTQVTGSVVLISCIWQLFKLYVAEVMHLYFFFSFQTIIRTLEYKMNCDVKYGQSVVAVTSDVIVAIQDVNDNVPFFMCAPYYKKVNEVINRL